MFLNLINQLGQIMIDCSLKIKYCHAICCYFTTVLEKGDYVENTICTEQTLNGLIKITKKEGSCECVHLSSNEKCGVYQDRPKQCKNYDCRTDSRIWIDFEANILNTEFIKKLKNHKL